MSKKLEKISHYAVIIIALSALVVSVMQTRIQQDHNKLTVKPYLHHSIMQDFDNNLTSIYVFNNYVPPATIKQIQFT